MANTIDLRQQVVEGCELHKVPVAPLQHELAREIVILRVPRFPHMGIMVNPIGYCHRGGHRWQIQFSPTPEVALPRFSLTCVGECCATRHNQNEVNEFLAAFCREHNISVLCARCAVLRPDTVPPIIARIPGIGLREGDHLLTLEGLPFRVYDNCAKNKILLPPCLRDEN